MQKMIFSYLCIENLVLDPIDFQYIETVESHSGFEQNGANKSNTCIVFQTLYSDPNFNFLIPQILERNNKYIF